MRAIHAFVIGCPAILRRVRRKPLPTLAVAQSSLLDAGTPAARSAQTEDILRLTEFGWAAEAFFEDDVS